MFTCTKCGTKTQKIVYQNGKSTCSLCKETSLSGNYMRRVESDRRKYAKDILQRYNSDGTPNKDFYEAYKNTPHRKDDHHQYEK